MSTADAPTTTTRPRDDVDDLPGMDDVPKCTSPSCENPAAWRVSLNVCRHVELACEPCYLSILTIRADRPGAAVHLPPSCGVRGQTLTFRRL